MWPGCVHPGTYSAASRPMRRSRHSSESAPPVDTAMSGMSPSVPFFGRLIVPAEVALHAVVFTVSCLRHLPTWMTSGMFVPTGAFVMVNFPLVSVVVYTIGLPWKSALHEQAAAPVGTPDGSAPTVVEG